MPNKTIHQRPITMELVNLSAEPKGKLYSWLPTDLKAETVIFLPDACPGKSPLPTGIAVLTYQKDWRRFAISDCGCGMRLVRSNLGPSELTQENWDRLAARLRNNKGKLGDLGGGNHFLDALRPYGDGPVHFLIHTGSRNESGLVDHLIDDAPEFDKEFDRIVGWAERNREEVEACIAAEFGQLDLILDAPHNTVEPLSNGGSIIRKGSVRLASGEICVIPSHMSGDIVLCRANDQIGDILNSMCHGTGRRISRGDCREQFQSFDFNGLRTKILMPSDLKNASLRTEGPFAYRSLEKCLALIDGYVEEEARFSVMAYIGHL